MRIYNPDYFFGAFAAFFILFSNIVSSQASIEDEPGQNVFSNMGGSLALPESSAKIASPGFVRKHDILLNVEPTGDARPFRDTQKNRSVALLSPIAEHLYLPNLYLPFRRQSLKQKTGLLFSGAERMAANEPVSDAGSIEPESRPVLDNAGSGLWSFFLPRERKSDFIFSLRQWPVIYEESLLSPVSDGDLIFLRNEARIFCLDRWTGGLLWSWSNAEKGEEFYHTLRPPHRDPFSYDLLVAGGYIFTELNGSLLSLDYRELGRPELLWERKLGEYSLCTKPVLIDNILVVCLLNARGELWIAGFDASKGSLEWTVFLGYSSSLSAPCNLSAQAGRALFLATNAGVLAALDAKSGRIYWVRKYESRSYDLVRWWKAKAYKKRLGSQGFVPYDTQFLEFYGGYIDYKPRESAYFYRIDASSGELIGRLGLDKKHILLGSCGEFFVFFVSDDSGDPGRLLVLEAVSGDIALTVQVGKGSLRGVSRLSRNRLLAKIGETLYLIESDQGVPACSHVNVNNDSWLVSADKYQVLFADGRELRSAGLTERIETDYFEQRVIDFGRKKERLKRLIGEALLPGISEDHRGSCVQELKNSLDSPAFPKEAMLEKAGTDVSLFEAGIWRALFVDFNEIYPGERVIYQGVNIKFSDLLKKNGIIAGSGFARPKSEAPASGSSSHLKGYSVRGERLLLVPVRVMTGVERVLSFYLLLNQDQLLCVRESGEVVWSNKVFNQHPYAEICDFVKPGTDKNFGRMDVDSIEAFLYKDTLIVNDRKNIVAFDITNGGYLWSIANEPGVFDEETILPPENPDRLFKEHGISRSYIEKVRFSAAFLGDRLLIIKSGRANLVDPETGYSYWAGDSDLAGILAVAVNGGELYALSSRIDKIVVYGIEQIQRRILPLDFISKRYDDAQLWVHEGNILLRAGNELFVIDALTGGKIGQVELEGRERIFSVAEDRVFITVPFEKMSCRTFSKHGFNFEWEAPIPGGASAIWNMPEKDARYAFYANGAVWTLSSKSCGFAVMAFDPSTGDLRNETSLGDLRGLFYYLSEPQTSGDSVRFVMTAACSKLCPKGLDICRNASHVELDSVFVTIDSKTGRLLSAPALRGITGGCENRYIDGFKPSSFAETRNYLLYTVQANELIAEVKR